MIGASGNLGSALLRRVQREPAVTEIVGVSRRVPDDVAPYSGVEWHPVDIGEAGTDARASTRSRLGDAIRGADAVVHLAWALQPNRDERRLRSVNVLGTTAVLDAVERERIPHLLVASSVGAYSPGPKTGRVDESWPTGGLQTSHYARHKAMNERQFDGFERAHPSVVLTRMRPGLVFQADAAVEVARLFAGPLVPKRLLGRIRLPVVPLPSRMVSQVVHADDVADAFWRAIERSAGGAFNLAAEPVVTPQVLATAIGGRAVPIRQNVVRSLIWASWKARLQPTDPGWLDIATSVPVMSTERARALLGWVPTVSSSDAIDEMLEGLASARTLDGSPPLG